MHFKKESLLRSNVLGFASSHLAFGVTELQALEEACHCLFSHRTSVFFFATPTFNNKAVETVLLVEQPPKGPNKDDRPLKGTIQSEEEILLIFLLLLCKFNKLVAPVDRRQVSSPKSEL